MQGPLTPSASAASQPDPSTPSKPTSKPGVIEVDTFCTHCHYNLHGQVVTIDERLEFPICRCPECGRFHPAGVGTSASTVWVRRFATVMLFLWIMIGIAGLLGTAAACFPLQIASVEAFTEYQQVPAQFPAPSNQWTYVQTLRPWTLAGTDRSTGYGTMLGISTGSLAVGFLSGILCVSLLWHWPRGRYLWTLLIPLLPWLVALQIYRSMPEYRLIFDLSIAHCAVQAGIQAMGILLGVLTGRKITRTLVRMFVPPKPRQALAFLWTVDGKTLPEIDP